MALVWHTGGAIFGCCLLAVFFGSHYITAKQQVTATWGEWLNITGCTARPYNCTGYAYDDSALGHDLGELVQMRYYRFTDRSVICQFEDATLALRKTQCDNVNVCPGWSEWSDYAPCTFCRRQTNNTLLGTHVRLRSCNNPAPIHTDVLCMDDHWSPSLDQYDESECECDEMEEEPTTTEAPVETTAEEIPCCEEVEYESVYMNAVMWNSTTTQNPAEDIQFWEEHRDYFELRDEIMSSCRACNETDERPFNLTN